MSDKSLLGVIEDLLEADMTKKDTIKNPQETEEMEEATENSVNSKNRTADGKKKDAATEKPSANTSADDQGVLGKDGTAIDAGGDKDVGGSKGDNASDASPDTQGVLGKDGTAIDAGGDKDVGGKKGDNPSDASPDTQGVLGKDGQALDAGGDKDVGKIKEEDEAEEEPPVEENKGVAGDTADTGVLDAGGDEDVGKLKEEDEEEMEESSHEDEMEEAAEEPSNKKAVDATTDGETKSPKGGKESADDQGVLGKDGQALDAGGDKDVGKLKEEDEEEMAESEEEMEEACDDYKEEDETVEEGELPDALKKNAEKMKQKHSEEDEVEESKEMIDDDAFTYKIAQAAMDGKSEIELDGKTHKVTMSKDQASKIVKEMDDKEMEEETEEDGLEESFKERAQIIFETAVNEKANMIREQLEEEYEAKIEEKKAELDEKVSEYLDYAVQEWIAENALEIKYSLRTEIAENFIRGLKGLFEENYIEIPDEDVSVVDELTETVESYKDQLEEQRAALEEANQIILEHNKKAIVEEIAEGLTQTQTIRLETLSESVEAGDIDEFRFKVEALREGYFEEMAETPFLGEEFFSVDEEETISEDSPVGQYANFIGRTVLK